MKWFGAWVTFSCVVVPAGSWLCARLREARRTRQPCLEGDVAVRDLELPCADSLLTSRVLNEVPFASTN